MNWQLKAITQKLVSILPCSRRINYLLQRYVTVGMVLPEAFVIDRLEHAQKHLHSQKSWGKKTLADATILEIGTGWYPLVPMAFMLMGAQRIYTADIHPLYAAASINQSILALLRLAEQHQLQVLLPGFNPAKLLILKKALKTPTAAAKMKILQLNPLILKPSYENLPSKQFDLVVSNNTLQFVEPSKIGVLFASLQSAMAVGGVISVAIDYTDEFSHGDGRIGPFNFLRFSAAQWRFWTNALNRPNRLRHIDYRVLFTAQFELVIEEKDMETAVALEKRMLHSDFHQYSQAELLVKHAYLVALNNTLPCEPSY
jgi:hypothetical protein